MYNIEEIKNTIICDDYNNVVESIPDNWGHLIIRDFDAPLICNSNYKIFDYLINEINNIVVKWTSKLINGCFFVFILPQDFSDENKYWSYVSNISAIFDMNNIVLHAHQKNAPNGRQIIVGRKGKKTRKYIFRDVNLYDDTTYYKDGLFYLPVVKLVCDMTGISENIVDLGCGGGTICLAAKKEGRNFIGIDNIAGNVKISRNRLNEI